MAQRTQQSIIPYELIAGGSLAPYQSPTAPSRRELRVDDEANVAGRVLTNQADLGLAAEYHITELHLAMNECYRTGVSTAYGLAETIAHPKARQRYEEFADASTRMLGRHLAASVDLTVENFQTTLRRDVYQERRRGLLPWNRD